MLRWRLKAIVDERKLKLSDVANKSGVSYRTIYEMYHNIPRHHRLSTLTKIANALGVRCEALIDR